LGLWPCLSWA